MYNIVKFLDKYLTGNKRKLDNTENDHESGKKTKNEEGKGSKKRQYNSSYLSLGFTNVVIHGLERPMCLLCPKVLATDSMRPGKLRQNLNGLHPEYAEKSIEYFQRLLDETNSKKKTFKNIFSETSNILLASYHVSYRIAKCKKTHTIGETFILSSAIDMVRIMFGESYAKQLSQIPLTVGRRINDISEDIFDRLISRLRTSKFSIQVDEAIDVVKDGHLIAYVRYAAENNIKQDILFCKPIPGRTTSLEMFNIIERFFGENDITWNNCIRLCTDGAHSMSGHKSGLQALVK